MSKPGQVTKKVVPPKSPGMVDHNAGNYTTAGGTHMRQGSGKSVTVVKPAYTSTSYPTATKAQAAPRFVKAVPIEVIDEYGEMRFYLRPDDVAEVLGFFGELKVVREELVVSMHACDELSDTSDDFWSIEDLKNCFAEELEAEVEDEKAEAEETKTEAKADESKDEPEGEMALEFFPLDDDSDKSVEEAEVAIRGPVEDDAAEIAAMQELWKENPAEARRLIDEEFNSPPLV